VNKQYDELDITQDDFNNNLVEAQWEPIPLDRRDERLSGATEALDAAIGAIETDNGYAVHAVAEREYVLSNLRSASKALKEQTQIYWMQVKVFALEPLGRIIKRFGPAAVGMAALAARQAIFDWLKANFAKALDWLP